MEHLLNGLRAAAEPTRLRVLALCAHGELTVSELTQILGQSQPRVSRHLKLLCEAGLLDRFREGTWAFFRVAAGPGAGDLARMLVDRIPDTDETVARDLQRLSAVKANRAEMAAAYFRANAATWDRVRSLYVDEREVEAALLQLLPLPEVGDLLDVGTGTGRIVELLGRRGVRAVGVDSSRDMLGMARANLERADLRHCQVRFADAYQLPMAAGSFDAVTIHQVLHYLDDPGEAIAEAARVLRPGGRLIIADFAPHELDQLRSEHAHRRLGFSDAEIAHWLRAAGLEPATPLRLPGDPLTVVLWPARRPRGDAPATKPHAAPAANRGLPH
ncbi:ArsR family transcriptional regulator [Allostella humosa]|nr:metalloregulator ArsR/SmtB family transcription factor [Stella humosa]BBK33610.1 ArsR family transcriptional regulator [Stella humosa]